MAPSPSEPCMRSIIHALAFSMAFRRTLFDPLRSHHFSSRSTVRKTLCQVSQRGSLWNAGLAPGSQISSRLKPGGTGRRGLAAWTMASDTTMARVHADIWYRKWNGSSTDGEGVDHG